ncbi:hypothetical protein [Agromyces ramosus]|uniref:Fatty acid desaturase n=1 Tax=Agromyces ramosus TaxID=33879 RepID=A0ABU0RCK3_9MICO|nr:hypothetical protein [Agromyces ramosus]MDQ0895786.1 fatty acid desaturase [Agromyces ramosus]
MITPGARTAWLLISVMAAIVAVAALAFALVFARPIVAVIVAIPVVLCWGAYFFFFLRSPRQSQE